MRHHISLDLKRHHISLDLMRQILVFRVCWKWVTCGRSTFEIPQCARLRVSSVTHQTGRHTPPRCQLQSESSDFFWSYCPIPLGPRLSRQQIFLCRAPDLDKPASKRCLYEMLSNVATLMEDESLTIHLYLHWSVSMIAPTICYPLSGIKRMWEW